MARKAHPYFGFTSRKPARTPLSSVRRSPHEPGMRAEDQKGALWDQLRGGMACGASSR